MKLLLAIASSILCLCSDAFAESIGDSSDEITDALRAIEASYEGTRFDSAQASLQQCVLTIQVSDSAACSKGRNNKSETTYIDLSAHRLRSSFGELREIDGNRRFSAHFEPIGEWKTEFEVIRRRDREILDQVREEIGYGRAAAREAAARFLSEYSVDELAFVRVSDTCDGGKNTSLTKTLITFSSTNPESVVQTLENTAKDCKDVKT